MAAKGGKGRDVDNEGKKSNEMWKKMKKEKRTEPESQVHICWRVYVLHFSIWMKNK